MMDNWYLFTLAGLMICVVARDSAGFYFVGVGLTVVGALAAYGVMS